MEIHNLLDTEGPILKYPLTQVKATFQLFDISNDRESLVAEYIKIQSSLCEGKETVGDGGS